MKVTAARFKKFLGQLAIMLLILFNGEDFLSGGVDVASIINQVN